jgi:hypothetical protein
VNDEIVRLATAGCPLYSRNFGIDPFEREVRRPARYRLVAADGINLTTVLSTTSLSNWSMPMVR